MRGQAGWAGTLLHGKCGRLALRFLKSRQYSGDKDTAVSDFAARELQLLLLIAEQALARALPVLQEAKRPVVIYSDASYEQGQARCGWVILRPGYKPVGQTVVVNSDWLAAWEPRQTQIFAAEAFCALLVPFNVPQLLADQDLLWFVDNEAAASAMIRGSGGSVDVDKNVQLSSILLLRLRARLWIEWVNSDANPSDGLSRAGLADHWTQSQAWDLAEAAFPSSSIWETLETFELVFQEKEFSDRARGVNRFGGSWEVWSRTYYFHVFMHCVLNLVQT